MRTCPRCGGHVHLPQWRDVEPYCLSCGWRDHGPLQLEARAVRFGRTPAAHAALPDSSLAGWTTNSMMAANSSSLFSMGVPVRAQERDGQRSLRAFLVSLRFSMH